MNRYLFAEKSLEPSKVPKLLDDFYQTYALMQAHYIVEHGKKPNNDELAKYVVERLIKQKVLI